MQTLKFENREDWMLARRGKITGSRLKDLIVKRGTGKKKGFYELIAERVAVESNGENPMDRGQRLEDIAIAKFTEMTGKEVDTTLVLWMREDDDNIAVSPDGVISKTEACEVKCLNSASHIEALLTHDVPSEYQDQALQYFIVNDDLDTLFFIFYDPRMTVKDLFWLVLTREELKEKIGEYYVYQKDVLAEVEKIVSELTF